MTLVWIIAAIILVYQLIRGIAKLELRQEAKDHIDQLVKDTNTLATIMEMEDRAKRVRHFVKRLATPEGNFANAENEMSARMTYYYFSIDVLRAIDPVHKNLLREAKQVNWNNMIAFQNKLHQLISDELEAIVNA